MSQATVVRILAIESEATRIRDEAAAQAARLLADFEREASDTRDRVLNEARTDAGRIEEEAKRTADGKRAEVITQAQADARDMEDRASDRMGVVIQYILDQVAGRT